MFIQLYCHKRKIIELIISLDGFLKMENEMHKQCISYNLKVKFKEQMTKQTEF